MIRENNLIDNITEAKKDIQIAIIADVAGTGKSAILSNYSERIKEEHPDVWVIRINLLDLSECIYKFDFIEKTAKKTAIDFFLDLPTVVGESSFARSLLRYRLETGDRVVLMLDGFDEIDSQCQEKIIRIVKSITKNPVQLYLTTRPHTLDTLQDQLLQFAYNLEDFTNEDQITFLASYWKLGFRWDQTNKENGNEGTDEMMKKIEDTL